MTEPRHTADTITDDALDALHDERDALLAELGGRDEEARERWIEKQLAETGLRSTDFRNGMAMEIEPAREMVAHWVGAARAMLGDAPNYTETPVEMEVKVGESPERFAFVLQRVAPGALTPHQARQRAEATIALVTALYEQWVQTGAPPLGTSVSRWWDARLVELHDAIRPPADQPTTGTDRHA